MRSFSQGILKYFYRAHRPARGQLPILRGRHECQTVKAGEWRLHAQETVGRILFSTSRGTVTGTVLDSSGAVISRAHMMLTAEQTGIRFTTDSNEIGVYRFDAVDLGTHDLTVERAGFKTCRLEIRGGTESGFYFVGLLANCSNICRASALMAGSALAAAS